MKINFRQGVISSHAMGFTPLFLAPSTTGFVNLVVSPEPTVVAFAHADSDYLQVFNTDIPQAWGPFVSDEDAFLYWEIDQLTANVRYKITRYPFLTSVTAPINPPIDQHWFDLLTTTMKYWTGTKWLPKIAVFAGSVLGGIISQLRPSNYGSQVGLNTPSDPGFIMLSSSLRPIYTNPATFEFLTTTKSVRIKTTAGTSGILATPPNAFVPVRASENIPAFSLVYFSGEDTVGLASSNPSLISPRIPIGIVQTDLSANEMGSVTQSGEVQWDQWNWSGHFGKPLYCTSDGQITHLRPAGLIVYRIGIVKNRDTILFGIDAETMSHVYQATSNDIIISGVTPLSSFVRVNTIGERVWSVEISDATTRARGAMTAEHVTLLGLHTTQIATNTFNITQRAALGHVHSTADVSGLNAALALKSDINHSHSLNSLSDVNTVGAVNGDALVFNINTNSWHPAPMAVGGGGGGPVNIIVQQNGSSVTTAGQVLNFTGDVSVTNVLGVPTINIAPSSPTQEIHGATTLPLSIGPGVTLPGDTTTYANDRRGFKFFVTITMPVNQTSQSFEVLCNISGNINTGAEVVAFVSTSRVGFNFAGNLNIVLDRPNRLMRLTWTNNEANPVVIQCIRIQHTA